MNEDIIFMKTSIKGKKFDLFSCQSSFSLKNNEGLFTTTTVRKTCIENAFVIGNTYPKFINEFWTSKQRQASSIHEISYRACFKPQLPRFFIERFSKPGDYVYDPFSGRGTTAIESALLRRNVIANDVNPLGKVITEPRFFIPMMVEVEKRLSSIP